MTQTQTHSIYTRYNIYTINTIYSIYNKYPRYIKYINIPSAIPISVTKTLNNKVCHRSHFCSTLVVALVCYAWVKRTSALNLYFWGLWCRHFCFLLYFSHLWFLLTEYIQKYKKSNIERTFAGGIRRAQSDLNKHKRWSTIWEIMMCAFYVLNKENV